MGNPRFRYTERPFQANTAAGAADDMVLQPPH